MRYSRIQVHRVSAGQSLNASVLSGSVQDVILAWIDLLGAAGCCLLVGSVHASFIPDF